MRAWLWLWLGLVGCGSADLAAFDCPEEERVCEHTLAQGIDGDHRSCFCAPALDADGRVPCRERTSCPTGTECIRKTGEDDGFCEIPADANDVRTRALAVGLDESLVDFEPWDPERPDLLVWRPDDERTEHIVCALFACAPEIDATEHIVNFDRCVLGRHEVDDSRIRWSIASGDIGLIRWTEHDCHEAANHPSCGCDLWFRPTRLLRGCWAYDDTKVFAASPLVVLDHEAITRLDPAPRGAWVETCDAETDGMPCHMNGAPRHYFGVCQGAECVAPDEAPPVCIE